MPLSGKDENGLLDGINAAAIDKRLSFIHAVSKETGDPVLLLCCLFNGQKAQLVPIAEIIVHKNLDELYVMPDEVRDLLQPQSSADIEVGIPGYDTL